MAAAQRVRYDERAWSYGKVAERGLCWQVGEDGGGGKLAAYAAILLQIGSPLTSRSQLCRLSNCCHGYASA